MLLGVTDLRTFVIGAAAIILLPGPNSMFVLSTAGQRGVRQGYRAAAGVLAGDTLLMVATATGAAAVLHALPALFTAIKYGGAAYLAYLGGCMLWSAFARWRGIETSSPKREEPQADAGIDPFVRAFMVSLINPKAILFLVSFFTQFVDPSYEHAAVPFLIEGAILQVFSFTYLSALIFGGTFLASQFRRHPRLSAASTSAVGTMFLGFSAKLVG
jgi:leucine efflux protein